MCLITKLNLSLILKHPTYLISVSSCFFVRLVIEILQVVERNWIENGKLKGNHRQTLLIIGPHWWKKPRRLVGSQRQQNRPFTVEKIEEQKASWLTYCLRSKGRLHSCHNSILLFLVTVPFSGFYFYYLLFNSSDIVVTVSVYD